MENPVFLQCSHCGNTADSIVDSGVSLYCCGEPMHALQANTTDAAAEKHVPASKVEGDQVYARIGAVDHPMTPEHHIAWVYLLSEAGGQRKELKIGGEPSVAFALTHDDKPLAVYAYCNLHGLWSSSL